jgi:hypothetical protein
VAADKTSRNDEATSTGRAHPSGLLPRLGLFTAIMIVMGNMIGSGVFKKAAPMSDEVQSAGLMLACWLIAGIISLLGALANAEVAGIIADPGGQYAYFKKMYGRVFAYLYGWTGFIVIQSASIGSIAYVFGQSANSLFAFPRLDASWEAVSVFGIFYPFDNLGVKLFTILTLCLITFANYLGVIFGGWIASVSSALKILGIAVVAVLGLLWTGGSYENRPCQSDGALRELAGPFRRDVRRHAWRVLGLRRLDQHHVSWRGSPQAAPQHSARAGNRRGRRCRGVPDRERRLPARHAHQRDAPARVE